MTEDRAFAAFAQTVHQQHALASGVTSWRECRLILCFKADR
jgi:hypothetical protein